MAENVGFRCCTYVLGIALADVISYIEDNITYSDELTINWSCYDDWKKSVMESSNTAFYWVRVIEHKLNLFLFICSIRENFALFVCTIDTMLSWTFALDHNNYARWMPVFIYDLKSLYGKYVYNEFCKGHFTVKKSNRAFSSIG